MKKAPMARVDQSECKGTKASSALGGPFRPIFVLMAEIGHNFILPFKNLSIYFSVF